MKKILFIAALFVSTGIISSCTKESEVAPTSISKKVADNEDDSDSGDHTATGDGGVDRPPVVKKP